MQLLQSYHGFESIARNPMMLQTFAVDKEWKVSPFGSRPVSILITNQKSEWNKFGLQMYHNIFKKHGNHAYHTSAAPPSKQKQGASSLSSTWKKILINTTMIYFIGTMNPNMFWFTSQRTSVIHVIYRAFIQQTIFGWIWRQCLQEHCESLLSANWLWSAWGHQKHTRLALSQLSRNSKRLCPRKSSS